MGTIGTTIVQGAYILTSPKFDPDGTALYQVTTSYLDEHDLSIHAESIRL
jgi:hypothetical protein